MDPKSETVNAIRRKLAVSRQGAGTDDRSVLRALRLAVTRAAPAEAGLPLAVLGGRQSHCGQDELTDCLPSDDLPLLLDGPGGRVGGLCLGRALVVATVRQLTTGSAGEGELPDRPYTEADAALVAPLVDDMLSRAAALAESPEDKGLLDGFRFGARMDSPRDLALALEGERFRLLSLSFQVAGPGWQGGLTLLLPESEAAEKPSAADGEGPGLDRCAGAIRARLVAVMCRIRVPLARLAALRPGDVLPLGPARFDRAELVAIDGRKIACGQLGRCDGMRAIRLSPADPGAPAQVLAGDGVADFDPVGPVGAAPAPPRSGSDKAAEQPAAPERPAAQLQDEVAAVEQHLRRISPEQAAAEISELAGLDPSDLAAAGAPAADG